MGRRRSTSDAVASSGSSPASSSRPRRRSPGPRRRSSARRPRRRPGSSTRRRARRCSAWPSRRWPTRAPRRRPASGPRSARTAAALFLIDQRQLPDRLVEVENRSAGEVAYSIREMIVRGAPAIGQVAAIGMALSAERIRDGRPYARRATLRGGANALIQSRPTAVNLRWAVDRMMARYESLGDLSDDGGAIADALRAEADAIVMEATTDHGRLAEFGLAALPVPADGPLRILTHCNTGPLACGQFGTALGIVQVAHHAGRAAACLGRRDPAVPAGRPADGLGAGPGRRAAHADPRRRGRPPHGQRRGRRGHRRGGPCRRQRRHGQQGRHVHARGPRGSPRHPVLRRGPDELGRPRDAGRGGHPDRGAQGGRGRGHPRRRASRPSAPTSATRPSTSRRPSSSPGSSPRRASSGRPSSPACGRRPRRPSSAGRRSRATTGRRAPPPTPRSADGHGRARSPGGHGRSHDHGPGTPARLPRARPALRRIRPVRPRGARVRPDALGRRDARRRRRRLVLEYNGPTPQPLFVMGRTDGIATILRDVIRPRAAYVAMRPEMLPAVEAHYRVDPGPADGPDVGGPGPLPPVSGHRPADPARRDRRPQPPLPARLRVVAAVEHGRRGRLLRRPGQRPAGRRPPAPMSSVRRLGWRSSATS